MGESKNGFVISDHMDTSLPKHGRSQKGSFTMTTVSPRAPRDENNRGKKQQTDPWGEDQKEKQKKLRNHEYMKCIYFGLKHKCFSNRRYLRIVKL